MKSKKRTACLVGIALIGGTLTWVALTTFATRTSHDRSVKSDNLDSLELSLESDAQGLSRPTGARRSPPPDVEHDTAVPTRNDPYLSNPTLAALHRPEYEVAVREKRSQFEQAATSELRERAMSEFSLPHQLYVKYGGGLEYLPFLRNVVSTDESPEVRKSAVIACHSLSEPAVVDLLIEWTKDARSDVRFYAVEGLAWVRGSEFTRAHAAMLTVLDDKSADVRQIAALSLGLVTRKKDDVSVLLSRLNLETDSGVVSALERGIMSLDPDTGRQQIAATCGDRNK